MSGASETVARVLTLVPWLLQRQGASVEETAEAFGVSPATILADLDTVGYCGLPGLGGGDLFEVSVVEDRVVVEMADELRQPLRLNPREALRLVLAGEAVAAALGDELPALRSALDRVRQAVGVPSGVRIELLEEGGQWRADLRRAIAEGRTVRLHYRGRADDAPTERLVDAWALHVSEGTWYVQGLDHRSGASRSFRLDRIAELEVTDEHASPPQGAVGGAPQYEPGPDDVEVELVLAPEARWVAESVRLDEAEDLPDGRRRVVFHTDALPWVRRLVLSAGRGVRVVRPRRLAREVRSEAAAALERYA